MMDQQELLELVDYQHPSNVKELPFTGTVRILAFGIAGAVIGLAMCFAVWLALGGWGPPSPLLFVGLGYSPSASSHHLRSRGERSRT